VCVRFNLCDNCVPQVVEECHELMCDGLVPWGTRTAKTCSCIGVSITCIGFFIASINGMINSLIRRVHQSLECIPRGFGAWGVGLATFWWHFCDVFDAWYREKGARTLISRRKSTKSTNYSLEICRDT
jgi:hypothetical protein